MRIAPIILKLRAANTSFKNRVAGAADLEKAFKGTLRSEFLFVVPLREDAELEKIRNDYDKGVNQALFETFGIVVAIVNDSTDKDKLGFLAYDRIHDIRAEIFKAILGWEVPYSVRPDGVAESNEKSDIYYKGGRLVEVNAANMWYIFEFEYFWKINNIYAEDGSNDGVTVESLLEDMPTDPTRPAQGTIGWFNKLWTGYIQTPSSRVPYDETEEGGLPISDPDMETYIDLTKDPRDGGFSRGYSFGFDKILKE